MGPLGLIALVLLGGWLFIWRPISTSYYAEKAACWWKEGTYVRFTAEEPGYRAMMGKHELNRLRLKNGDAKGCLPQGACLADPVEAGRLVEKQLFLWQVRREGGALGAVILSKLSDGRGLDLPGLGQQESLLAEAKRQEAAFCASFLQKVKQRMTPQRREDTR